jgi:hypothetical protein
MAAEGLMVFSAMGTQNQAIGGKGRGLSHGG